MVEAIVDMNRRLAAFAMGDALTQTAEIYLEFCPCVIGRLTLRMNDLRDCAKGAGATSNALPLVAINRDYLNFSRRMSVEVLAGQFHRLVQLDIDFAMAKALAALSNQQILALATRHPGTVVDIDCTFARGHLDETTSKHHAAAAITGRLHPHVAAHP